jgi:hypothetical protein
VLGVRLEAGDAAAQLAEAIAGRGRCLIVLDNFEQVAMHAAATVGRWLDGAPEAAFMVTSRERLNVAGETVQPVEPLPLNGPAIDLFVVRAQARRPGFVPDDAQRAVVAEITSLLDGLPLAIELAAARIGVLSPAQLLLRLRDRFALLAGRGGTGRQATLRAAIDWSWQLLSAWEQAAFEQCSVFEGGFTLAAAEAVIDLVPWPDAPPVVDTMQALLDKSLLRRWSPPQAEPRQELDEPYFGMYLSIHEYATEKRRQRRSRRRACAAAAPRPLFRRVWQRRSDRGAGDAWRHATPACAASGAREPVVACHARRDRGDGEVAVACYRAAWEVLALQGPFSAAVTLGGEVTAMKGLDVRLAENARLTQSEALMRVGAGEGLETAFLQALGRVRGVGDRRLEGTHPQSASATSVSGRAGRARRMPTTTRRSTCFRDIRAGCWRRACWATWRSSTMSRDVPPRRWRTTKRR